MQTLTSTLPGQLPSQSRPDTLDLDTENLFAALPVFAAGADALAANLNSIAAGGAYALSYTYSTTTATIGGVNGGFVSLSPNGGAQNVATSVVLDVKSGGVDYTGIIDTMDSSTNPIKGQLLLYKAGDKSKYVLFDVTARAAPAGYRTLTATPRASSSANPFANNDAVQLAFQRTGDKGDKGDTANGFSNMVILRSTQSWTPPAGITKAKITIVDGGTGGGSSATSDGYVPGKGGAASVSIRTINPAVTYTATVGAGGAGAVAGSNNPGSAGGASSFSGTGFTTLTSSNGDLLVPGAPGFTIGTGGFGGESLLSNRGGGTGVTADGIGQGGNGTTAGNTGKAGGAGAVVIEY